MWLSGFLREINTCANVTVQFTYSNSNLLLSENPFYHERSKHIAVKFHFSRDMIAKECVNLCKRDTNLNPTDFSTRSRAHTLSDQTSPVWLAGPIQDQ